MKSRLLLFLDSSIANASSVQTQAMFRTKRAIYYARRGDIDETSREIGRLREYQQRDAFGDGIAGANLAEAVVAAFTGPLGRALDKLRRVLVICGDPRNSWIGRSTLSWQVHVLQNLWRSESIPPIASELIASVSPSEHDVISRLTSVIAVGLHLSDHYPLARPWYECARLHALAEGDDLTLDANLYNVAATRLNNLCLALIEGMPDAAELERASWEVASSTNYDELGGVAVFPWSISMIQGRLALLQGRHDDAVREFDRVLGLDDAHLPVHYRSMAQAERSFCAAKAGDIVTASSCVESTLSTLPGEMSDDDLALVYWYSSQVLLVSGNSARCESLAQASLGRLARFRCTQALSSAALSRLPLPPAPPKS